MNNIDFNETLTAATIGDETVHIDWFDTDEFGMISEFRATDGRTFDVRTEGTQASATVRA